MNTKEKLKILELYMWFSIIGIVLMIVFMIMFIVNRKYELLASMGICWIIAKDCERLGKKLHKELTQKEDE